MALLQQRATQFICAQLFVNTFFMVKLRNYNYDNVKAWSKVLNVIITRLDQLFVPIHVRDSHWWLAVVDFVAKQFVYYDSLAGLDEGCFASLRTYIQDEAREYNQLPKLGWMTEVTPKNNFGRPIFLKSLRSSCQFGCGTIATLSPSLSIILPITADPNAGWST